MCVYICDELSFKTVECLSILQNEVAYYHWLVRMLLPNAYLRVRHLIPLHSWITFV